MQSLSLWYTNVGDEGIAHLRGLRNLRDLDIRRTSVTNSGLFRLKDLPNLAGIFLGQTLVDDNGLLSLEEFKQLKKVEADGPGLSHQFTPAGVARFKRALPNCEVIQ